MIVLDVVHEAGDWPEAEIEPLAQRAAAAAVAALPDPPAGPLGAALLLTNDDAVRTLNRVWRDKDQATNVLSFPAAPPVQPGAPRHLGDVALAYETVAREAEAEGKPILAHAAHLVVHGILHLLGEDHADDREADIMERAEVEALASLGIADPYRHFA